MKGAGPDDAIEDAGGPTARVAVGRARPLGLVLRAFDLR